MAFSAAMVAVGVMPAPSEAEALRVVEGLDTIVTNGRGNGQERDCYRVRHVRDAGPHAIVVPQRHVHAGSGEAELLDRFLCNALLALLDGRKLIDGADGDTID